VSQVEHHQSIDLGNGPANRVVEAGGPLLGREALKVSHVRHLADEGVEQVE
jgi:hypothetical protein